MLLGFTSIIASISSGGSGSGGEVMIVAVSCDCGFEGHGKPGCICRICGNLLQAPAPSVSCPGCGLDLSDLCDTDIQNHILGCLRDWNGQFYKMDGWKI